MYSSKGLSHAYIWCHVTEDGCTIVQSSGGLLTSPACSYSNAHSVNHERRLLAVICMTIVSGNIVVLCCSFWLCCHSGPLSNIWWKVCNMSLSISRISWGWEWICGVLWAIEWSRKTCHVIAAWSLPMFWRNGLVWWLCWGFLFAKGCCHHLRHHCHWGSSHKLVHRGNPIVGGYWEHHLPLQLGIAEQNSHWGSFHLYPSTHMSVWKGYST